MRGWESVKCKNQGRYIPHWLSISFSLQEIEDFLVSQVSSRTIPLWGRTLSDVTVDIAVDKKKFCTANLAQGADGLSHLINTLMLSYRDLAIHVSTASAWLSFIWPLLIWGCEDSSLLLKESHSYMSTWPDFFVLLYLLCSFKDIPVWVPNLQIINPLAQLLNPSRFQVPRFL